MTDLSHKTDPEHSKQSDDEHKPHHHGLSLAEIPEVVTEKELSILNSDAFYNQSVYDTDSLTVEEIQKDKQEGQECGAKRYFLKDGKEAIGILEYLQDYPSDGYMWIGLLQIRKEDQGKGYGLRALELFYERLEKKTVAIQLGVVTGNEPGHRFWRKNGFVYLRTVPYGEKKEAAVYEKRLSD
ncbi:GNAT family N-acetyltransferase [Gorillibacterium massiliense]|uniref:GNAT family N-acetyltransferase n=1 Tax=Gorillibacterium massiliense TaxID=1280390 RepID=UPI0004AE2F4B|nr:GNAT family N-acetyltransferase [Gorillibacterium massiliense]